MTGVHWGTAEPEAPVPMLRGHSWCGCHIYRWPKSARRQNNPNNRNYVWHSSPNSYVRIGLPLSQLNRVHRSRCRFHRHTLPVSLILKPVVCNSVSGFCNFDNVVVYMHVYHLPYRCVYCTKWSSGDRNDNSEWESLHPGYTYGAHSREYFKEKYHQIFFSWVVSVLVLSTSLSDICKRHIKQYV